MNKILKNIWINKVYLILILLIFLCVGYGYTYFFTVGSTDANHIRDLLIFADKSIKGTGEIRNIGLNILSSIPVVENIDNLITQNEENKQAIDSYNKLLKGIEASGENVKTVLVSSVNDGEGKSTVVANLGYLFAKSGKKTLIVDADMHSGVQNTLFSVRNKIGLSNFLVDADSTDNLGEISAYIQATKEPNLFVMTYGIKPPNPAELLEDGAKLKETIEVLGLLYDAIVIDSVSFKVASECTYLGEVADKTIIVVEENYTTKDALQKLKDSLENSKVEIAGIVFNKASEVEPVFNPVQPL